MPTFELLFSDKISDIGTGILLDFGID